MTNPIKPEDLKVGDVVDVTFRRMKVALLDWTTDRPVFFEENGNGFWAHTRWLSTATITKSPEVIKPGDTVQIVTGGTGGGGPFVGSTYYAPITRKVTVLAISGDKAWVDYPAAPIYTLSNLTLISKGVKS